MYEKKRMMYNQIKCSSHGSMILRMVAIIYIQESRDTKSFEVKLFK